MWDRTRHGLPDHPFAASFEPSGELWTQCWPDQITAHGIVRAYAVINGVSFIVGLMGVKDRFEMKWKDAMHFKVYTCSTGELVQTIEAGGGGALTIPQSVDTDLLVIGYYV
jgi:hypothetical protein